MNFSWSDAQQALKARMIEFAQNTLDHDVLAHDLNAMFPADLWQRCAEQGVQGISVSPEWGGQGEDVLSATLAMEGLGYGCRNTAFLLALNAQMWTVQRPIEEVGTPTQKARYLPGLVDGSVIGVQAVTEVQAGSDVAALACRATREGDGFLLTGEKVMITGAPHADLAIVLASTDPDAGRWGITAFIVELDAPGVSVGAPRPKMGMRSLPFGDLSFDGCFVPEAQVLGAVGAGLSVIGTALEWERSCMLASFVGVMERQLEQCVTYARQRQQFGRPIGDQQAVSHRIADMRVRLEAARLLLYKAAWQKSQGGSAALECAIVKLYLSEGFLASSLDAVRVHGGYGYLPETGVERDLRDAIGGTLYGGTSDIQRNIIASLSGL